MIVINDTLGVRGGTMTLLYRMCKWYVAKGADVCVFYEDDGNDEIKGKIESIGVKTIRVGYFSVRRIKEALDSISPDNDEIEVINFNLNHYMDVESIRRWYHYSLKNLMYVIHPDCLKKGKEINNSLVRSIYKEYYYRIISKMVSNNALVFMDSDTVSATKEHFNKQLNDDLCIIPLPIDVPEIPDYESIIKEGYQSNIILTASRADFPFKGYLLGLVDCFAEIKSKYPDTKLHIFSDGDDIGVLVDKINGMTSECRDSIVLDGWISYEKLIEEIKKSRVFVGMATGLLDSSKNYRIAIPVKHSTIKCISSSFFYEQPLALVEEYRRGMPDKTTELLMGIFRYSYEEYKEASINCYRVVNKLYNEDTVMRDLTNVIKQNSKSCLSCMQCFLHFVYQSCNKIRFKNDYNGKLETGNKKRYEN